MDICQRKLLGSTVHVAQKIDSLGSSVGFPEGVPPT